MPRATSDTLRATGDGPRTTIEGLPTLVPDSAQAVLHHFGVAPTSRMLELEQPRMRAHVLEVGTGIPTLLFPPGDGEAWNFAPLMAQLADGFHLHAVDRPSFGQSDRVDYRTVGPLRDHAAAFGISVLDALGLDSALVIGASFGAIFGFALTVAAPERVHALVLPGYPAGLVRRAPWRTRARARVRRLGRPMVEAGRTAAGQKALLRAWGVGPDDLPDAFYAARAHGATQPGAEEAWRLLRRKQLGWLGTRREAYFGDDLPRITQPVLQLWGEREANPLAWGRAAISRLPHCRFELMPGVGHFPYLQAPRETARLIRSFVDDHPQIARP